ncbi:MAG: Ig-like domain-containing protein, partial [Peptoanaerobacter stomatis]|uniref:Ig-like domain-containing protein n=1 Tax=Peptoanaerobacter stomatis TaxID=796937 RepID=UPI003FA15003
MITIKRKISFILAFVLILSCFYNPNKIVYAAAPDVQVKITLNHFDAKDELKSANKTIQLGGNAQIKDAHISTPIQIDFQDKNNNNPIHVKTTNPSNTLKDFIILTKDGDTTNLVPSIFNHPSFVNTNFSSIKLSPLANKSLDPDSNYTLKIDTSKLSTQSAPSTLLGNQNFVFKISSERTPKITSISSEHNKLKITFDRKIDKDIANNAIIDNNDILLKDKNGGVGATFKKLSEVNVNSSIQQKREINYETNTTTSTVLVGPIKDGKYTVLVNSNISIPNIGFVRNREIAGSEPTISNPVPLYAETKNQSNVSIKYKGFDVSKNIVLKKFTTSQSSATIALANAQSASNIDIDVDTLINDNNITINQNIPDDKSLFVKDGTDNAHVSQAVTITPTILGITMEQKENESKKDRIEINSASATLAPNTKYTIEIDKSKFLYDDDPIIPAGNTKEKYTFTTEKRPQLTLNTKNIEKGSTNSTLTLTSSRPIQEIDTSPSNPLKDKIIVKDVNSTPIPIVSASLQNNNTLTIVLDVSSSALGNASINIPANTFKRYLSKELQAEAFNDTFTISRPSSDLKATLELKNFSSSDELITFNESDIPSVDLSALSSSKTIDNLLIDSDIKIKLSLDVKAKSGKTLEDILKLSKGSVAERITDYYNITPANVTTGFDEFTLTPKKPLEPSSEYTLTVDNSKLADTTYNASIGDTKFVFLLKTEKQPVGTQGTQVNKDYSVTFDRKIDMPSVSDIKLYKLNEFGQYTEFSAISPSDIDLIGEKTLVIRNLPTGKYQIKLNADTKTIKRKNVSASVLYAKEFLGAVQDDTKPDFEIKSLASTVSDYIRLNKFEPSGIQVVQVNKIGETNKNNTQIETDTPINVKFTIPYTYTNNAFSINLASDTTSPSLGIKSVNKKISSSGAIDGVDIVLKDLLLPDTKYKLKIYKNKFTNSQGSLAGTNNETEEYEFTTEAPPVLLSADVPKIEKKATDQTITL